MSLLDALRYRLRVLLRPGAHARELDEEIRFHLSLEAMQREHAARGALTRTPTRAGPRGAASATSPPPRRRHATWLVSASSTRREQDVRFALRIVPPRAGLHRRRRADARHRHRREHRDLQRRQRAAAPPAAVPGARAAHEGEPHRARRAATSRRATTPRGRTRSSSCSATRRRSFADLDALDRARSSRSAAATDAERDRGELVDARYLADARRSPRARPQLQRRGGRDAGRPARRAARATRSGSGASTPTRACSDAPSPSTASRTPIVGVLPAGFRGLSGRAELLAAVHVAGRASS